MNEPTPGSAWQDVRTLEVVIVESFDGGYAVVVGEHDEPGRGRTLHTNKPNAFLVHPSHFGTMYKNIDGEQVP